MSIAVVIPTHNRKNDLLRAIGSLSIQTSLPDEIIVIDDGSMEPVTENIFDAVPKQVIFRLLRNEVSKGANNARNRGINEAKSEWIAFLDDDDEFKANKIEVIKSGIAQYPDIDVFYHPSEIYMINEDVMYVSNTADISSEKDVFKKILISDSIGGTSMTIGKRRSLIDVALFDEQLPALQDHELWLRMAKAGKKFKFINLPLTKFNCVTNVESISKSLDAHNKAISLLEDKYKHDYALLNKDEIKTYQLWKNRRLVYKKLLNYQIFRAFSYQCKYFFKCFQLKYLLFAFAILCGPRFVFRLRARFGQKYIQIL
jgi:glycosyltransferase involved in cell wall biosynthesis